jgi:hypothetical protein
MTSETAQLDSLERFNSETSTGASIRDHTTPLPTAAERIREKLSALRSSSSEMSVKLGELSIKAYVLTTLIIVSTGAGLVYDRYTNPNYQSVSPTTALLETAAAIGGQIGGHALREMKHRDTLIDALPYSSDRTSAEVFNYISQSVATLQEGPIADALGAYGLEHDDAHGWMETGNITPLAEFVPTPEDIATLIEETAILMGTLPNDPAPIGAVESTLDQVIKMKDLCYGGAGCPPMVHSIKTDDGQGMIAIYQGEARTFQNFSEGVHFLDQIGWTEAYDASKSAELEDPVSPSVRP